MPQSSPLSWVNVPVNSDFTWHNLPFGIFSDAKAGPRVGVAIGEDILDLAALRQLGFLMHLPPEVLENAVLNDLIALGKSTTLALRHTLQDWLRADKPTLQPYAPQILVSQKEAQLHLPLKIGDYTDFYSSLEHATNVGAMFRDPKNALLPNWRHLPVGYHGRASSIIVSGTPIHRPLGQTKADEAEMPDFGPSRLLDFELEMAFVVGKSTTLGQRISTAEAEDYIFGLVLFNDWSARDIQKWEYVPLGPFLGKSFASSLSPWVVMLEALEPFRSPGPVQEPAVLPYLRFDGLKNYDIQLEVAIQAQHQSPQVVCQSNFKYMYWNMCQQLAHHSVNGCNFNVGDLCASGTISGPQAHQYGSMLELTWRGTKPIPMPDGTERRFIQDYDTVIMKGFAEKDGLRVGFGEVRGQILPSQPA
ncbi:MAG: fumarylacetoacetase [Microscillaceae bacterium]|nr:fumarylacetoacetase [Microscillaceae bacterium]